jgi:hypothetical protein
MTGSVEIGKSRAHGNFSFAGYGFGRIDGEDAAFDLAIPTCLGAWSDSGGHAGGVFRMNRMIRERGGPVFDRDTDKLGQVCGEKFPSRVPMREY